MKQCQPLPVHTETDVTTLRWTLSAEKMLNCDVWMFLYVRTWCTADSARSWDQLPPTSCHLTQVLCRIIKRTNQTEHHHLRLLLSDGTTNLQPSCSWLISVVSVSEKIWIQHELLCNWLKTINRQPHLIYFPISPDIFRGLYTVQRQSVAADTDLVNGLLTRVIGPVLAAMMSV